MNSITVKAILVMNKKPLGGVPWFRANRAWIRYRPGYLKLEGVFGARGRETEGNRWDEGAVNAQFAPQLKAIRFS